MNASENDSRYSPYNVGFPDGPNKWKLWNQAGLDGMDEFLKSRGFTVWSKYYETYPETALDEMAKYFGANDFETWKGKVLQNTPSLTPPASQSESNNLTIGSVALPELPTIVQRHDLLIPEGMKATDWQEYEIESIISDYINLVKYLFILRSAKNPSQLKEWFTQVYDDHGRADDLLKATNRNKSELFDLADNILQECVKNINPLWLLQRRNEYALYFRDKRNTQLRLCFPKDSASDIVPQLADIKESLQVGKVAVKARISEMAAIAFGYMDPVDSTEELYIFTDNEKFNLKLAPKAVNGFPADRVGIRMWYEVFSDGTLVKLMNKKNLKFWEWQKYYEENPTTALDDLAREAGYRSADIWEKRMRHNLNAIVLYPQGVVVGDISATQTDSDEDSQPQENGSYKWFKVQFCQDQPELFEKAAELKFITHYSALFSGRQNFKQADVDTLKDKYLAVSCGFVTGRQLLNGVIGKDECTKYIFELMREAFEIEGYDVVRRDDTVNADYRLRPKLNQDQNNTISSDQHFSQEYIFQMIQSLILYRKSQIDRNIF